MESNDQYLFASVCDWNRHAHRPLVRPIVLRPLFLGGIRVLPRNDICRGSGCLFPAMDPGLVTPASFFTLSISIITASTFDGCPTSGPCDCKAALALSRSSCSRRSAPLEAATTPASCAIACRCASIAPMASITSSVYVSIGPFGTSNNQSNNAQLDFHICIVTAAVVPQ